MENQLTALQQLEGFLQTLRINRGEAFTHTTKLPSGSYFVPAASLDNFYIYICNAVRKQFVPTVTEKPGPYTPLRVDCDFKSNLEQGTKRQYTERMVQDLIEIYQDEIEKIVNVDDMNDDVITCCLLEKKAPRADEGVIKDGFHLHFPFFITEPHVMEYIREKVNKRISECKFWNDIKVITPPEKIIDDNIGTKTWFMYGCAKTSKSQPYLLTRIYGRDLEELKLTTVFEKQLVGKKSSPEYYLPRLMTIRGYMTCTKLREDVVCRPVSKPRKKKLKIVMKRELKEILEDIKMIKDARIMQMLSKERADDFHKWMDVGWTLFNIGQGHEDALNMWIEFSQQSSKFEDGVCEEKWYQMEIRDKGMGSLMAMAKTDSPDQYKAWKDTNLRTFLHRSLYEKKPNEYDVCRVVCKMYEGRFICANPKKDEWYEFKQHRWREMNRSISLKLLIVEEVTNIYYKFKKEIVDAQQNTTEEERSKLKHQQDRCDAIITALKTINFSDKVVEMCKLYMYDPLFYRKLDENSDLWVFENGVYDLKMGMFREGRPDDYCSYSCGHNYREYTDEDDEIGVLNDFLAKVFPNPNIRTYMLNMLCLAIGGKNVHKVFACCTGTGNNGKSVTFELIQSCFGDYCICFAREVFVGRYNSSGGPRPELARVRGRRAAVLSEIAKTEKINVGVLKEMTGNDAFFARTLNDKGMDIRPKFTLFLQCNALPEIPGHDEATWERVRVINYESKFNKFAPDTLEEQQKTNHYKADPYIRENIPFIAPALLWKLISMYADFKKKGNISEPKEVTVATQKYKTESDIYLQFIEDKIEKVTDPEEAKKSFIKLSEMYNEFKDWFSEEYSSYKTQKIGKSAMKRELSKRIGPLGEKSRWWGYKLIQEEDDGQANLLFAFTKKENN